MWHQIERSGHPAGLWAVMMAVLMAFVMGPTVAAADGKRVAFVVGIGTYDNLAPHQQLTNAVNDAKSVSEKLAHIGFQVIEAPPNLTSSDFDTQWGNVLNELKEEDTFVLFFSGHGVQIGGQNYLLPRDIPHIEYGRPEPLKRKAISLGELLENLSTGDRPHPKRSVLILDACRDDPTIPPEFKGGVTRGGLARPPELPGTFIIYSAASNRIALDRLSPSDPVKNSAFTRVLLPLMERKDLSIQTLSVELKEQVAKLAQNAGYEQQPAYYDGLLGRFCLPECAVLSEGGPGERKTPPIDSPTSATTVPSTITGKDGAPMVLIPVGKFQMGSPDSEGNNDEHPRHSVGLNAFYLDKYEVTNLRFDQFVREKRYITTAEEEGTAWVITDTAAIEEEVRGAHWLKPEGGVTVFDSDRQEHPVVSVSWVDAHAYCGWAGKRLPTEAEFEYATRAGTKTKYWWGDGHLSSRRVANIADESLKQRYSDLPIMTGYDDGYARTAPVGSFEANPFGLHDMTGNVWEWTADWYGEQYYRTSPRKNPKGPPKGDYRVVRGASWFDVPTHVRSAHRREDPPTSRHDRLGFRCAQESLK